ncbi:MAG: tRNA (adenosine(37)-N6)-threonylcarbamoyltransferase complex ATPase subunit type 1 TsaE [Eubacteriaceae bacterium]|jgi:tRNA threonylcarbamoyladenosine biosynthesis protein TsaE
MDSYTIHSSSPEQTEQIASALGAGLEPPAVLLLNGEMGAGKTAFSKAFARGAGSTDDTASPTYTIAATYDSPRGPIHHFDLYRLADPDELYETGFDDYLADDSAFLLIEWPEKAELSGPECIDVQIRIAAEHPQERTISFSGSTRAVDSIKEALKNYG